MKRRIEECFFGLLLGIMVIKVTMAFNNLPMSHRVKRQEKIGQFKSVRCDRILWKTIFEPYLNAERELQLNPDNLHLSTEFEEVVKNLTQWRNAHFASVGNFFVVCGLHKFLECNEVGHCVCGTGAVPYSFETSADGSICLGKRGNNCYNDMECAPGLMCQERYCGGSIAFIEESKKMNAVDISHRNIHTDAGNGANKDPGNDAHRINSTNGKFRIYSLFLSMLCSLIAVRET